MPGRSNFPKISSSPTTRDTCNARVDIHTGSGTPHARTRSRSNNAQNKQDRHSADGSAGRVPDAGKTPQDRQNGAHHRTFAANHGTASRCRLCPQGKSRHQTVAPAWSTCAQGCPRQDRGESGLNLPRVAGQYTLPAHPCLGTCPGVFAFTCLLPGACSFLCSFSSTTSLVRFTAKRG